MIQLVQHYTKDFTKETFLGRIESIEIEMRHLGELTRVETTFSAMNTWSNMSRSTSARVDFANSSRFEEDKKIEEGIALLVRRQKEGVKIIKCWTCDEYGHYAPKCPKREK